MNWSLVQQFIRCSEVRRHHALRTVFANKPLVMFILPSLGSLLPCVSCMHQQQQGNAGSRLSSEVFDIVKRVQHIAHYTQQSDLWVLRKNTAK